ncbi:MAG TPA: glucose 1-dehydrogenase [Mycobacteriales bacterium]
MGRVDGKVAVVTGAARGLGAAQARALAAEGASVLVTDLLREPAEELVEQIGAAARFLRHDVTDSAGWKDVVGAAEDAFGPVTVLVNNAGIFHGAPIEDLDEADFRRVVEVNQVGTFLGMRSVLQSMRRAGGGSIVNVSSIAGMTGFPGFLGYTSTKWAVRGMTKAAAVELAADNIRVNSVHPGVIDTEMVKGLDTGAIVRTQPIPRMGTPEEVAMLVLFLASDESAYSTGSEFVTDGGYTCQ